MKAPPNSAGFVLGIVILGAGDSKRMGRPKLLLPWGKTTIIRHLIGEWGALGARQVGIVSAAADEALQREIKQVKGAVAELILNPTPRRGMFGSIQCAARWPGWRAELTHWAIALGDQPHLRTETLAKLMAFARAHPDSVCQPLQEGRKGHPVLFPKRIFRRLISSQAADLKQFLRKQRVIGCAVNDPGLHLDLDTPDDYHTALALAGASGER